MVKCECGREFKSLNGFHAHSFYCSAYLDLLSEDKKSQLLERRRLQQNKRKSKHDNREAALVYIDSSCPICSNSVRNRADQNPIYWNKCCSKSCAQKLRWRERSEEERLHIRKLAAKANKEKWSIIKQTKIDKFISENHHCEQCGEVITVLFGSGRFCSKKCSDNYCKDFGRIHRDEASNRMKECWQNPEIRKKFQAGREKCISEGRWPRMMHSYEPSYPEKYWMSLLNKENILFKYNYLVKHSDIGVVADKLTWYKLDFYLEEYKIDLEIDGNQHYTSKECIEHDKLRDERLTAGGYIVYRIPWIDEQSTATQLDELKSFIRKLNN